MAHIRKVAFISSFFFKLERIIKTNIFSFQGCLHLELLVILTGSSSPFLLSYFFSLWRALAPWYCSYCCWTKDERVGDICSSFLFVFFFLRFEENKSRSYMKKHAWTVSFLRKLKKNERKQNKTQESGFPSAPENLKIRARLSKSERARWM